MYFSFESVLKFVARNPCWDCRSTSTQSRLDMSDMINLPLTDSLACGLGMSNIILPLTDSLSCGLDMSDIILPITDSLGCGLGMSDIINYHSHKV